MGINVGDNDGYNVGVNDVGEFVGRVGEDVVGNNVGNVGDNDG